MTFWDGSGWVTESSGPTAPKSPRRLRDRVATLIMVAFIGVYLVPFGGTRASGPTLTLSPASGGAGTKVNVVGQGFTPKSTIALTWDDLPTDLALVTITGSGRFRASFKIPKATAGSHSLGTHQMLNTTVGPILATAAFVVTVAVATAAPTTAATAPVTPTPNATATPRPTVAPTPAATAAPTQTPASAATLAATTIAGFVSRCGEALCLSGERWYLYGASQLGGLDDPSARATLAESAGLNTLRIVNFLDERGAPSTAYDEGRWLRVDRAIAAAQAHRLHVLLDLSTYRNLLWNAGINPYTADWQPFLAFVANRRNEISGLRYADDPTIAIISFAGEVEPLNTPDNTRGITTAQVTGFFKRSFGQWKALDPHHLTSSGGLLQLDWDSGIDWRAIFALADNDVCSIHSYSRADQTITTPAVSSFCASIGHPWMTEEFGWEQSTGDAVRAGRYDDMYGLQRTFGAAGVGSWNLGTQLGANTYDVNSGTPLTWDVMRANAP